MTPVAIVLDRPTAARGDNAITQLGGSWTAAYELWKCMEMPYLVMMAHTKRRIRQRAPLTAMVTDEDALRTVLRHFCGQLHGPCRWLWCVDPSSPAMTVIREEVLRDAMPSGLA